MKSVENVMALQRMLNATLRPPPGLVVDGVMGPKTRTAFAQYSSAKLRINHGSVGRLMSVNDVHNPMRMSNFAQSAGSDTWMAIAEAELGTAEIPGAEHNQRIIAYHSTTSLHAKSDEVPWCSSFVNWVMRKAGYIGTNSAAAASWISWGASSQPEYGCITVIKRKKSGPDAATGSSTGNHVGFLVEKGTGWLQLLGGNQGDMVKLSNFHLSAYDVRAHRWPSSQ